MKSKSTILAAQGRIRGGWWAMWTNRLTNRLLLNLALQHPLLVSLTVLLGFAGACFNGISTALIVPVLLNFLGQNIPIDSVPPLLQSFLAPFADSPDRLLLMGGAILLLIVCKNIATYASSLAASALKHRLTTNLREAGLRLLLTVDLDFHSKNSIGDLINRLNTEVSRAANAATTTIRSLTTVLTILVFVGILLSLSWPLTIAASGLLAIVTWVNQFTIRRSKQFGQQLSELSKTYSIGVLEVLSGMRLVRSLAAEAIEFDRIRQLMRQREQAEFRSQANFAAIAPISEVTSVVALIGIVALGRAFLSPQIETVSAVLLTYLFVLFRTLPLVSQLNDARSQAANAASSVELVKDFLRLDNKPFLTNGTVPFSGLVQEIRFDRVGFTYPHHDAPALQDITLSLPQGTTLALVGASGAGKSTLVDLLLRFYDPTAGKITLDGRDLREFDWRSLRRSIGIVSQDTFLFNTSVRHNIAYGWPQASEAEIVAAAKRANAYDFILDLPQGFDTPIGDRGVLLSGGQRQRIAIARALLQNPEILILDEATSALDTISERLVQQAIDELSHKRTTLVIAHRLSTVQNADQIAVLDRGCIVECGTHTDLLAQDGDYARLYATQFGASPLIARIELARTSHHIRDRLNTMLGSLRLMVDGLIDTPAEQREWTQEAYAAAIDLLKSLESLEQRDEPMDIKGSR